MNTLTIMYTGPRGRPKPNYHIDPQYRWVQVSDIWVGQCRLNRDFMETRTWVVGCHDIDGDTRWLKMQQSGQLAWWSSEHLLELYPWADLADPGEQPSGAGWALEVREMCKTLNRLHTNPRNTHVEISAFRIAQAQKQYGDIR